MAKRLLVFILLVLLVVVTPTVAPAQGESPDERARITERKMTDDERFSLLISMLGYIQGGARPDRAQDA
jgi:hypothetical protein